MLCSEQKGLQKSRKHKIKQLMKCTVQIMGMGFSSVLMVIIIINYSECMYLRASSVSSPLIKCHYSSKHTQNCRQLAWSLILFFYLIKKEKDKMHINNLQYKQPYSSILIQILYLYVIGYTLMYLVYIGGLKECLTTDVPSWFPLIICCNPMKTKFKQLRYFLL